MSGNSMRKLFDLTNQRAVVTGAAQGLGKSIAVGLRDAGAHVALIDVAPGTVQIAETMTTPEQRVEGIVADLGNRSQLQVGFEQAVDLLGGIDILVNNAGVQRRSPCEVFPIEDWDLVLEVNLSAVFQLCQLAGRLMLEAGYGRIINIASLLSFSGGFTVPAYAASKGGVVQLTKALANEWTSRGVNVNAIAPGYMDTALNVALVGNPEREPGILARIPANRWGSPDDLKGAAVFLASAASDYVSGIVLPVDGGFLAW